MTSENDFQAALDAQPDDWQTRLVFADWLDEWGDPRGDGYRAIARQRRVPVIPHEMSFNHPGFCDDTIPFTYRTDMSQRAESGRAVLPNDWLRVMEDALNIYTVESHWYCRKTRREVEDTAALAFGRLPPERRAELLAAAPAGKPKPRKRKK